MELPIFGIDHPAVRCTHHGGKTHFSEDDVRIALRIPPHCFESIPRPQRPIIDYDGETLRFISEPALHRMLVKHRRVEGAVDQMPTLDLRAISKQQTTRLAFNDQF